MSLVKSKFFKSMGRVVLALGVFSGLLFLAIACTMNDVKKADAAQAPEAVQEGVEYYEVYHENGRLYVFGDEKTYASFLAHDETPFTITRIAAGPKNETLVFGLSKEDSKKSSGIAHVDIFEGGAESAGKGFYGEIVKDGRFYVFGSWDDMARFRKVGEATYTYTMVGGGKDGATVVYVLNSGNKKARPVELIERFERVHGR